MSTLTRSFHVLLGLGLALTATASLAQGRTLTAKDYDRAAAMLSFNTRPLVDHAVEGVHWMDDHQVGYALRTHDKVTYMRMDPATGKARKAFDAKLLARHLGALRGKPLAVKNLRLEDWNITADGRLEFKLHDWGAAKNGHAGASRWYTCSLGAKGACMHGRAIRGVAARARMSANTHASAGRGCRRTAPRKCSCADWNLWVRDLKTGDETRLTTDGVKNFGYATDNAGWLHSDGAIVRWSPDSTHVVTYQQDQRKVGDMYTVTTRVGHPKLNAWKYPLPGDKHVFMIEPVVIDVDTRQGRCA